MAAIESAKTPPALQEVAFTSALALLAGDTAQVAPTVAPGADGPKPPAGPARTGSDLLDKIAAGLGLATGQIVYLFAEKDGEPVLKVKASKLPGGMAAGARDISLLVMAARQLGGIEEYTETDILRDACKLYSRLESKNSAKYMKVLDHCTITSNKSKKLTHPGVEVAAELAMKYLSEE